MKPSGILLSLWIGWLVTLMAAFVTGATQDYWWQGARLDLAMVSCLLLAVAAWTAWWALTRHARRTGDAADRRGHDPGFLW